jgi:GT2 family glycosyltransferase
LSEPVVSVVIVSYNVRDLLRACLRSVVEEAQNVSLQVVVVDNNSQDDSVELVRTEFPAVELLANAQNLGFAKATNQGIRESRGRFILLLNPDTVVHPGAIRELVSQLEQDSSVAVAVPRLINADGSSQPSLALHTHLSLLGHLYREFQAFRLCRRANEYITRTDFAGSTTEPLHVEHASGACMLVSRKAVEDVGLLDEDFFFQGEDCDWCLRMRRRGWQILYWPRAVVTHYQGRSDPHIRMAARQANLRHVRYQLISKHRGAIAAAAFRAIVFSGQCFQALIKATLIGLGRDRLSVPFALIKWALLPKSPRQASVASRDVKTQIGSGRH